MKTRKRKSPFSIDFWMDKGYSYDDANYKRNSFRPIAKEYWLERGYDLPQAEKLAKERKDANNKKGAKASASRTSSMFRESSVRCPEYWIKMGLDSDQANTKVREIQSTFSLEKCISKYGLEEGTKIHRDRQEKWQETINNKSPEELKILHAKKNSMVHNGNETDDEFIARLNSTRNMSIVATPEQFIEQLKEQLKDYPNMAYYPIDRYIDICVPKIQRKIFSDKGIDVKDLLEGSGLFSLELVNRNKRGRRQAYQKWTEDGRLLRSSYEIYFYDHFIKKFGDRPIQIGCSYPDSNFKFDFCIDGVYIEIAPEMGKNEEYTKKMNKKKELFGCILLTSIREIQDYLDKLT